MFGSPGGMATNGGCRCFGKKRDVPTIELQRLARVIRALTTRVAEAESLLRRTWSARMAFSLDPGGPANMVEGMQVVEKWIASYFQKYPFPEGNPNEHAKSP